ASPTEGASRDSQSIQGGTCPLRRLINSAIFDAPVSKCTAACPRGNREESLRGRFLIEEHCEARSDA
ncbi:hypothetical protein, partial [Paraburkholderia terricola]|uniref:hypothetical protein n=1 Tax=Paraburkholderia terricola TaxID=169427 RepID=UPI00286A66F5